MSGIATAVVASAVVGGVVSSKNASKARKSADAQSDAALAFEREKYQEWQDTYGPIEDSLGKYYSELSPDEYAVQGLEVFQQEQDAAFANLEEQLAQRGITDSGLAADAFVGQQRFEATQRANIKFNAPRAVAEEQSRFLQIGLGQNPGASYSSALQQSAANARQLAGQAEAAAGQAVTNAVDVAGTALSGYLRKQGKAGE